MNGDPACRLGVDVGGTFTDLVFVTQDGRLVTRKVLSTSSNYAEAIFAGITDVLQDAGVQATAYRKDLTDVLPGCFATFYGVRRT